MLCNYTDGNRYSSDKSNKVVINRLINDFVIKSEWLDKYYKVLNQNHLLNLGFNPFAPNAPFPYPLTPSETLTIFWCFQGVEKGCIGNEWVNVTFTIIIFFYYLLCHIYEHLLPCYLLIPTQDKNQNQKQKYFFGSVKTWDKLFWWQSNL